MDKKLEYITLRSPYPDPRSTYFNKWLSEQYDNGNWELVCPVNAYVVSGNSRDDNLYIFRRFVISTNTKDIVI